jgi:hypothetical protein
VDAGRLSTAVVHWLEFERLCGREQLFSELGLRRPIGEFLLTQENRRVVVEESLANISSPGRPEAVDYCLKRTGGSNVWTDAVECKWINDKRSLKSEIFKDLLRLEGIRRRQTEPIRRWFCIAGKSAHLKKRVVEVESNPGGGMARVKTFYSIIGFSMSGATCSPKVAASDGWLKRCWEDAGRSLGVSELPLSFRTELAAQAGDCSDANAYICMIWRVTSASKRSLRPLDSSGITSSLTNTDDGHSAEPQGKES